ncbi:hypothetical protein NGB36_24530 [Streptomyces sp. RB6PN25]|uniref:Transposase n=1 Tax=Streptomyces humicola TaxID=2953240 RepID=A0ABT1Q4G8_9ACTN|nr:hypothetical protein [Streptomyces humicola]MCQ4083675.1 hypothetical protein [Streptomyces humicola]
MHAADAFVAGVMKNLAAAFAKHKRELEGQWNRMSRRAPKTGAMVCGTTGPWFNLLLTA